MSKKADEKVMKLRKELLKRKTELLGSDKPVYIAGEYFRPDTGNSRGEFQVRTATNSQLLYGLKTLLTHKQATSILNMDETHLGFSVEDWIKDFKIRKTVLDRADNLRKVSAIEAGLKDLLSRDQLREIGIDDLADRISEI